MDQINNFGDYMRYTVLPMFGIRVAERVTAVAANAARDAVARAITSQTDAATRFKEALQTSKEQIKDQIEKVGGSLAGSKLLSALSSLEDAVMLIKPDKEGSSGLIMKSNLVPETLQFIVPDRAARLLESAGMDANNAFCDHANVSIRMRIEAIKIQIQCAMLLTKDDPKACSNLISKLLISLWNDRELIRIMAEKVKKFPATKKTTLDAKAAISTFSGELIHDVPNLHKLGFHLKNLPAIMNSLASPNCIPLGWFEGLPVMLINGDTIYDVAWDNNIYAEISEETQMFLNTDSFEFQRYISGSQWSLCDSAIVSEEVYESYELLRNQIDIKELFKYLTKSDDEKKAYYCEIKLEKFIREKLCVWTPSKRIVIFGEEKFYVTWPLKSIKDVEWNKWLTSHNDVTPTQIIVPVEAKKNDSIQRLLYAEDSGDDKIAIFTLHDGTIGKYIITRDKPFADYSTFITIPSANEETPEVHLDLLRWSNINDALINVSVHDNGMFQFRLIDRNGAQVCHSVVSISDNKLFPPKFQWQQFDNLKDDERLKFKRENEKSKCVIFKNDCIFLCGSFRLENGSLVFGEQISKNFRRNSSKRLTKKKDRRTSEETTKDASASAFYQEPVK